MRYTLKIDVDLKLPKKWLEMFIKSRKVMLEGLGFEVEEIVERETERGHHFWIRINSKKKLSDMDINMLQFLCSDDWGRVIINAYRIKRGVKKWNKLFSKVICNDEKECAWWAKSLFCNVYNAACIPFSLCRS